MVYQANSVLLIGHTKHILRGDFISSPFTNRHMNGVRCFYFDLFSSPKFSKSFWAARSGVQNIYSSVVELFGNVMLADEFPLRIAFERERGFDLGGVYRDMLSAFWDAAYSTLFDGAGVLTPVLHPQINPRSLSVLGRILSHGYLSSGFFPVRIAFPTLATLLLQSAEIDDTLIMDTFYLTVSTVDADAVREWSFPRPTPRTKILPVNFAPFYSVKKYGSRTAFNLYSTFNLMCLFLGGGGGAFSI